MALAATSLSSAAFSPPTCTTAILTAADLNPFHSFLFLHQLHHRTSIISTSLTPTSTASTFLTPTYHNGDGMEREAVPKKSLLGPLILRVSGAGDKQKFLEGTRRYRLRNVV
jgi:hypothetical protein